MRGSTVSDGVNTAPLTQQDEGLSRDELLRLYRTMLLSRRLDDKEIQLKNQSKSFFQISGAGHEAILVAAGMQLVPGRDWFFPYYRDRALCLALGLTPYEMLLSAVGAAADPTSGGRQMPAHWSKPELQLVSASSAVATQCLHAVGCAEASQFYLQFPDVATQANACSEGDVVYVSLGDGSTSEGEFWESLNTACTRRLPVLFLVEDNGYAISVPVEIQTPGGDIARLVSTFPGLEVISVDGTDALASYAAMRRAVAYTRGGHGPALVKANVVRLYSHSMSDDERQYKSKAERDEERRRDPLTRFARFLTREQLADDNTLARIASEVDDEIQDAADRAVAAAAPDRSTVLDYVYSPDVDPASDEFDVRGTPEGDPITMVAAINRTLKDEMERNPKLVIFGQDVADCSRTEALSTVKGKGGVFKATLGLQRAYGRERVFNSPLAEANIVGRAIGMALRAQAGGRNPVLRLHLARHDADPRRTDDVAVSIEQRLFLPASDSDPDRRVSAWRLALPQPVRREHLRALPGVAHRLPERRRRRRRAAPDGDPVRRPGPVSRAQTFVSSDLQQIDLPRTGPPNSVRAGTGSARRHRRRGDHVGRARTTDATRG